MGRTNVLTLTCPHCARQLRVGTEHAGWRTRCPHPDCRRSLTIPLNLDHDDEPEEAVLIAEGPPVPIAVVPRRGPRDSSDRHPPRGRRATLLWVLTGLLMGATIAVVVGWTLVKVWRARSPTPEASARGAESPDAKGAAPGPPQREPQPTAAPGRSPFPHPDVAPAPVPDVPIPQPVEPKRANPGGREVFVGRWAAVDLPVMQPKIELSVEFRDDGTCEMVIEGIGGGGQRLGGMWRWEDDRLTLSFANVEGAKPSMVKWNGPNEFVATNDNMPVTFRRLQ